MCKVGNLLYFGKCKLLSDRWKIASLYYLEKIGPKVQNDSSICRVRTFQGKVAQRRRFRSLQSLSKRRGPNRCLRSLAPSHHVAVWQELNNMAIFSIIKAFLRFGSISMEGHEFEGCFFLKLFKVGLEDELMGILFPVFGHQDKNRRQKRW